MKFTEIEDNDGNSVSFVSDCERFSFRQKHDLGMQVSFLGKPFKSTYDKAEMEAFMEVVEQHLALHLERYVTLDSFIGWIGNCKIIMGDDDYCTEFEVYYHEVRVARTDERIDAIVFALCLECKDYRWLN